MSAEKLLEEITTIDEYGFVIKPWLWWIPETTEEQIKRLQMNQDFYKEFIKGGHRFPPEINQARTDEFHKLQQLKSF